MHEQDAVERRFRQWQRKLVDQRSKRRPPGRPFQHALCGRHEGNAALAVVAEQAEIGRGIAEAKHALALRMRPTGLDAAIDQPPRHDSEALRIEIAEVDNVHTSPMAFSGGARPALDAGWAPLRVKKTRQAD